MKRDDPAMTHFHPLNRIPLLITMLLGMAGAAWSQDAAAKPGWQVIVECQMVVLPQKAALPLLADLRSDAAKRRWLVI